MCTTLLLYQLVNREFKSYGHDFSYCELLSSVWQSLWEITELEMACEKKQEETR